MSSFRLLASQVLNRQVSRIKVARTIPVAANHTHNSGRGSAGGRTKRYGTYAATFSIASIATAFTAYKKIDAFTKEDKNSNSQAGEKIISRKEVAQHDSLGKRVWITYKANVYDITDFIAHHPGGSHTIMMGAGGDVEPFWQTYTVHEAHEVQKLLHKYKIGILPVEEQQLDNVPQNQKIEGPYANDPKRSSLLVVLTEQPFNAETPLKLLPPTKITPTELFFVRNHLPVPEVDLKDYTLTVCVGTDRDLDGQKVIAEFTLDELKTKFKPYTIESVIQCSGNRRSDLKKIKEIKGLNWKAGAMGNAKWTGVRLIDLLDSLGVEPNDSIKHVQMEGLDCDMTGKAYAASVSADVAFDPRRDALLAYEMNGQQLSRDHGFPLRFVAPGITGARNVKWLSKIILSDEESTSHWQRNDYKSFSPNVDMFNLDYNQSISIQEMPVQSAICDPEDGEELKLHSASNGEPLKIPLEGYAYSGGGKMIIRVDVSIDDGKTWMTANLIDLPRNADGTPDFTNRNQVWSWTRWSLDVTIPSSIVRARKGSLEVLCRAFDAAYNSQPERPETVWNVRGVVNNSWHKIKLSFVIN